MKGEVVFLSKGQEEEFRGGLFQGEVFRVGSFRAVAGVQRRRGGGRSTRLVQFTNSVRADSGQEYQWQPDQGHAAGRDQRLQRRVSGRIRFKGAK